MFKSIKYNKYLGYDPLTDLCSHEYEITDTDFVEIGHGLSRSMSEGGEAVVINIYSKRNLNVAANLMLLFKLYHHRHRWSIQDQIYWCRRNILGFDKYEKDLEKYLLLI